VFMLPVPGTGGYAHAAITQMKGFTVDEGVTKKSDACIARKEKFQGKILEGCYTFGQWVVSHFEI